jgi:hypothetical protein
MEHRSEMVGSVEHDGVDVISHRAEIGRRALGLPRRARRVPITRNEDEVDVEVPPVRLSMSILRPSYS